MKLKNYNKLTWIFPQLPRFLNNNIIHYFILVAEKDQTHFKLQQQMQIHKTQANRENIFINLTTYAQHQIDNPSAAFKKSAAKTENTTEVFPGTHKSDRHPLV